MDNQHKKIIGYRDLSQSEIDGINSIKALEADAADLVKQLKDLPDADHRSMALAVTNLQQACMWLTKGVARSHNPFA
jgi:hypothetical protein